jgi:hypothetical protein
LYIEQTKTADKLVNFYLLKKKSGRLNNGWGTGTVKVKSFFSSKNRKYIKSMSFFCPPENHIGDTQKRKLLIGQVWETFLLSSRKHLFKLHTNSKFAIHVVRTLYSSL